MLIYPQAQCPSLIDPYNQNFDDDLLGVPGPLDGTLVGYSSASMFAQLGRSLLNGDYQNTPMQLNLTVFEVSACDPGQLCGPGNTTMPSSIPGAARDAHGAGRAPVPVLQSHGEGSQRQHGLQGRLHRPLPSGKLVELQPPLGRLWLVAQFRPLRPEPPQVAVLIGDRVAPSPA